VYWLADTQAGGAYGYTRRQVWAGDSPRESLEKFIPKDHLWPSDDVGIITRAASASRQSMFSRMVESPLWTGVVTR